MEGKSYMSSFSGRKLVSVSVPQESSSQTTHLLLGFNEIEELCHSCAIFFMYLPLIVFFYIHIFKIGDYV